MDSEFKIKLKQLQKRLEKGNAESVKSSMLKMVEADREQLTLLNKEQLFDNKDTLGKSLGVYSAGYAAKKGSTKVNLLSDGDFYDGFFIQTQKFPVVFSSKDFKTKFLVGRYGKNIFGLSKDSRDTYIQASFKRRFKNYLRDLLRLQ